MRTSRNNGGNEIFKGDFIGILHGEYLSLLLNGMNMDLPAAVINRGWETHHFASDLSSVLIVLLILFAQFLFYLCPSKH